MTADMAGGTKRQIGGTQKIATSPTAEATRKTISTAVINYKASGVLKTFEEKQRNSHLILLK
jgi:hypothetical protein